MKRLTRESLIHAVRIAAAMADKDPQRNPAYAKAMELMASALEKSKISSRIEGDYWLVPIPDVSKIDLNELRGK